MAAFLLLGMCQGASAAVQAEERAGSYNSSFSGSSLMLTTNSSSDSSYRHHHDYSTTIKCYNRSYTNYKVVSMNYVSWDNTTSLTSSVAPGAYSDSEYTGRYFTGGQSCTVTVGGTSKTHNLTVD